MEMSLDMYHVSSQDTSVLIAKGETMSSEITGRRKSGKEWKGLEVALGVQIQLKWLQCHSWNDVNAYPCTLFQVSLAHITLFCVYTSWHFSGVEIFLDFEDETKLDQILMKTKLDELDLATLPLKRPESHRSCWMLSRLPWSILFTTSQLVPHEGSIGELQLGSP